MRSSSACPAQPTLHSPHPSAISMGEIPLHQGHWEFNLLAPNPQVQNPHLELCHCRDGSRDFSVGSKTDSSWKNTKARCCKGILEEYKGKSCLLIQELLFCTTSLYPRAWGAGYQPQHNWNHAQKGINHH